MNKHHYIIIVFFFVFATALLINGCTTLRLLSQPTSTYQTQNWQQHCQALSHISRWSINGAFSIQKPGKTVIAVYDWQQQARNYHIHVHSSLDIYSVNISGRFSTALLWRSPQERYIARAPEEFTRAQLEWQLPISNLYYWIRGIPAPGAYRANFHPYGHLITLQQNGWYIRFSQYTHIGPVDLPRVLQLNSGQLTVKIIITHWKFVTF